MLNISLSPSWAGVVCLIFVYMLTLLYFYGSQVLNQK